MRDVVRQESVSVTAAGAVGWRVAIVLGVLMILSKLPFVLTTIGEQDQARMILSAMVYASDGPATMRPYGLFTSPLWVVPFAGLSWFLGADALLQISNAIGWLASGATTMLAFVLMRLWGVDRVWAGVGGIVAGWVPGAFYSSLYGYPSQFALPFLLGAALAFHQVLRAQEGRRWFVVTAVLFALLVFLKVDFALAGTLLLAVALLDGRLWSRWVLALAGMVVAVAGLFWLAQQVLVQQSYAEFVQGWNDFHPGRPDTVFGDHALTIVYGCGWATLLVWVAVLVARVVRRQGTEVLREALAWAVATLPLWLFWLLHPPMSTRHALPGILVTSLFATRAAARLFPGARRAAVAWLVVVLGGNALVGAPGFDINYNPSGRLFSAIHVNQNAYAVGTEIGRAVAERREKVKVVFGELDPDVLGGLDFHPMIEFAVARQARRARCRSRYEPDPRRRQQHAMDLVFTHADGHETQLYRVTDLARQRAFQAEDTGFYAPWGTRGHRMHVPVVLFDPQSLYRDMRR